MRIKIEQYAQRTGSKSARLLSEETGHKRLRHLAGQAPTFQDQAGDVIINWGKTERRFHNATYINEPEAVKRACDKRESFKAFREHDVQAVPSTEAAYEAMQWLKDGYKVYARTLTRANSGRGIEVVHPPANGVVTPHSLPAARLYTRGVECETEYRVHVMQGEVIRVQEKRRRNGHEYNEVHHEIRNAANNWVFCQSNISLPTEAGEAAVAAVKSLGLDFGAVDVGSGTSGSFVFEVNTAPGLEGTTLAEYAARFTVSGVRGIIARKGIIL